MYIYFTVTKIDASIISHIKRTPALSIRYHHMLKSFK